MQKQYQNEPRLKNVRGLYVHVPFCAGKCYYCAFYSIPYQPESARQYLRALATELKQYPRLKIETVYFGGGTPSILSVHELETLCRLITANVSTPELKEWTVEANPDSLTAAKLAVLAKWKINRISLGAQAFDDQVLHWLGRRHSAADIHAAVRLIKAAGFANFGLDLIAAVPGFDLAVWKRTLQAAVALSPKHISVYALTREESSRLAQAQVRLLSEDEELETLALAENILNAAGYARYEISNYARPGGACLHNLAGWRGKEYIGLGPAAAAHVGLRRWTNAPDLAEYLHALRRGHRPPRALDRLTRKIKQMEIIVFGLRLAEGVNEADAGIGLNAMLTLQNQGLLSRQNGRWRLTARGRNLADYVGAEILAGAG